MATSDDQEDAGWTQQDESAGCPLNVERLVELAVTAPVGLAALAQRQLPDAVRTGRERLEQQIVLARFVGRLTVQQAQVELRRRLEGRRPPAPAPTPGSGDVEVHHTPAAQTASVEPPPVRDGRARAVTPSAGDLAIADFDSLAAAQVVARLPGLSPDELELVEQYELGHRRRRTVLGRISQLRATG